MRSYGAASRTRSLNYPRDIARESHLVHLSNIARRELFSSSFSHLCPPWLPENRFLIDQGNWAPDAPYPFQSVAFPESTDALPIELFQLPSVATHIAPDGSEIRELGDEPAGGLAVCALPSGHVTRAVRHQTIEELWYVLDGRGELSRRKGMSPTTFVTHLRPGAAVYVEPDSVFQFRATGREELNILILTMPRWPGPEEAVASDSEETWKPTGVGNGALG